jgi:23S rRNA (uracil1939-C5)-methyltransferase
MEPGLTQPRRIVDLYCGAGTFSIFFASRGAQVVGIEENAAAVREARANAELNAVADRATFYAGRVESVLGSSVVREALTGAGIVFLDPPRKGSDEMTLRAVADAGVKNIWYLSCNPATLARDVAYLRTRGYSLGVVQPFDMFPHTGHIEVLATLYHDREEKLDLPLPAAMAAEWDAELPVWPADEKFSVDVPEYPDFVER